MYWTLEMALELHDAPWPATKFELLDYAHRAGLSAQLVENLLALEDEEEEFESIEDIWPDYYLADQDYFFNAEEY